MEKHLCRLCECYVTSLVKSHIVPSAICKLVKGGSKDKDNNIIIIDTKLSYTKRNPNGIYSEIVCEDCEKKFQTWDQCAVEFFKEAEKSIHNSSLWEEHITWKDYNNNYHNLEMFFLSLLWRADASDHEFFSLVSLTKKERSILSKLVLDNPVKEISMFKVGINAIRSNSFLAIGRPKPILIDQNHVRSYIFNILNLEIYIACDKKLSFSSTENVLSPSYTKTPLVEKNGLQYWEDIKNTASLISRNH